VRQSTWYCGHYWSVVPDDGGGEIGGMLIDRGTEVPGENLLQCHFVRHKSHMTYPGCRGGKPATNRLSYGTATVRCNFSCSRVPYTECTKQARKGNVVTVRDYFILGPTL
jgi:hypothetical protein